MLADEISRDELNLAVKNAVIAAKNLHESIRGTQVCLFARIVVLI